MEPVLAPSTLRRLERSLARLEGAQQVAVAANQVANNYASQHQEMISAALEDAGVAAPTDGIPRRVDIDWSTGAVRFVLPEVPLNGSAH